jgi:hypothetical protein
VLACEGGVGHVRMIGSGIGWCARAIGGGSSMKIHGIIRGILAGTFTHSARLSHALQLGRVRRPYTGWEKACRS